MGKDRKSFMISLGALLGMARHHEIFFNCSDSEMSLAIRLKTNHQKVLINFGPPLVLILTIRLILEIILRTYFIIIACFNN